jgi:predicted nuclease with TOPRIM domain
MKYSYLYFVFTLVLIFSSAGAQASFKMTACEAIFSEERCIVYQQAYKTLKDLQVAKNTILELKKSILNLKNEATKLTKSAEDLRATNKDLEKRVTALSNEVTNWQSKANDSIEENKQLKDDIEELNNKVRLLEPDAKRFQKFMQMFPHTDNINSYF